MKKIFLFFLVGSTILNLGCSSSDDLENQALHLRIKNSSNQEFNNIKIGSDDQTFFTLENLMPGGATLHSKVESFPDINTIVLFTNGEEFRLDQPDDENLDNFASGYYTLGIDILNEENKTLKYSIDVDTIPDLE